MTSSVNWLGVPTPTPPPAIGATVAALFAVPSHVTSGFGPEVSSPQANRASEPAVNKERRREFVRSTNVLRRVARDVDMEASFGQSGSRNASTNSLARLHSLRTRKGTLLAF